MQTAGEKEEAAGGIGVYLDQGWSRHLSAASPDILRDSAVCERSKSGPSLSVHLSPRWAGTRYEYERKNAIPLAFRNARAISKPIGSMIELGLFLARGRKSRATSRPTFSQEPPLGSYPICALIWGRGKPIMDRVTNISGERRGLEKSLCHSAIRGHFFVYVSEMFARASAIWFQSAWFGCNLEANLYLYLLESCKHIIWTNFQILHSSCMWKVFYE